MHGSLDRAPAPDLPGVEIPSGTLRLATSTIDKSNVEFLNTHQQISWNFDN